MTGNTDAPKDTHAALPHHRATSRPPGTHAPNAQGRRPAGNQMTCKVAQNTLLSSQTTTTPAGKPAGTLRPAAPRGSKEETYTNPANNANPPPTNTPKPLQNTNHHRRVANHPKHQPKPTQNPKTPPKHPKTTQQTPNTGVSHHCRPPPSHHITEFPATNRPSESSIVENRHLHPEPISCPTPRPWHPFPSQSVLSPTIPCATRGTKASGRVRIVYG
ncbi:TolA domain-containing protein [Pseudoscardovia radai]|uniref:TolA domain-containing protein n=1 Tax=Pseudoscardovia radai TaxID=987066 RepID=A0A261EPX0_9BIFI|nr:TolA domain-containing protein [Pseudoscardovia radai]